MDDKIIKSARKQLGGLFQQRREQLGISREDLGAAVGVTAETIKGIETGRFKWDIDLQHKLCAALGIKPYFSHLMPEGEQDYRRRTNDDPERYHGFYIADNQLLYGGQAAIVKLTHPRLFLRFNYADSIFATFEDFKANIAVQEWLDPGDKPNDPDEIEAILIDCWNFLALHEEEEDRINEENEE